MEPKEAFCGVCQHFDGEECTYGDCEGDEKYPDSLACDYFEDIE